MGDAETKRLLAELFRDIERDADRIMERVVWKLISTQSAVARSTPSSSRTIPM